MRSTTKDRMPHETRSILEAQIKGVLPIGSAADAGSKSDRPTMQFPRAMRLDPSEVSELIGPNRHSVWANNKTLNL